MGKFDTQDDVKRASYDLADKAIGAGVVAADSLERAALNAQQTGEKLMSQGAELGNNLQKVAGNFSNAIDKSISEQPMTTLGVAVAAGFVLGALWKA